MKSFNAWIVAAICKSNSFSPVAVRAGLIQFLPSILSDHETLIFTFCKHLLLSISTPVSSYPSLHSLSHSLFLSFILFFFLSLSLSLSLVFHLLHSLPARCAVACSIKAITVRTIWALTRVDTAWAPFTLFASRWAAGETQLHKFSQRSWWP